MRTAVAAALLLGSLLWLAAILCAPLWHGALSAATYVAGGFVCHQRPERSFHLAGRPMPVCARCTGLYAAAPLGAIAALVMTRRVRAGAGAGLRDPRLRAPRPPASRAGASRVRALMLAAATPTAIALAAEWLGFARPSGAARALAAAPLGAATAWVVTRAIRTE